MSPIATIKKNAREELRITLEHYQGHDIVNLRVWYQREDGEWRPGKQGLAMGQDKLPELAEAIQRACVHLAEGAAA